MRSTRHSGNWCVGCVNVTMAAFIVTLVSVAPLRACPFCPAVEPTFAQERERADWVGLVEVVTSDSDAATVRVRALTKGDDPAVGDTLRINLAGDQPAGTLVIAARSKGADDAVVWKTYPADETSYAYFYRAPSRREPTRERLVYFVRYLEHDNPTIAADAFAEFAQADYDEVAAVAGAFDMASVRAWVADPDVPPRHKGLYGLVLGLADNEADRAANAKLLKQRITADESDFRAGFDGLLAGYLLLEGEPALVLIEERFLAKPAAASAARPGDTRHAMTALRFYHEYADEIPPERLSRALRLVLNRPEFADAAIVDLARWQDWDSIAEVLACRTAADAPEPATTRAVVGYLIACPLPAAQAELKRLRAESPEEIAAAESFLELFGGGLPKARAQ